MRRVWAVLLLLLALAGSGCRIARTDGGERESVEYTVLNADAIPPEVERIIREQEGQAFQMTYKSGGYLYILRGYGEQETGGYSIQVEEVSVSERLFISARGFWARRQRKSSGEMVPIPGWWSKRRIAGSRLLLRGDCRRSESERTPAYRNEFAYKRRSSYGISKESSASVERKVGGGEPGDF